MEYSAYVEDLESVFWALYLGDIREPLLDAQDVSEVSIKWYML